MRRILALLFFLAAAVSIETHAQTLSEQPFQPFSFPSTPFGACTNGTSAINQSNGTLFYCLNGSWVQNSTPSNLNGIIFVDGVTYKTLAAAVTACATNCVIYDTSPETFATDPFASATGKNIEVHLGPGVWTIASSGTYGMTVPSNTSLLCGSQASQLKVGNNTNYVNDIVLGGYASINTVNNARIDNCTIDGNAANNTGGSTNAVVFVAGGFPVNGQPGGNNHITRNVFLTSPGVFVMVSDVNVSGTLYPSVGDEIGENVLPTANGCGSHCVEVLGNSATGGEFFNTRIHDNRVYQAQGFGIEVRVANGVIVSGNQVEGLVMPSPGTTATVNTTNSAGSGCASNLVTFTSGVNTGSVAGSQWKINRLTYTVSQVIDSTHFCLKTAPGTQTGVAAYGGSLELIHHDTAAFGTTVGNILRNGSDNCMSFINMTGGQTVQGYKITGNLFVNCGGMGISGDSTTGAGLIKGNDISGNTVVNAGQGGAAEALQFDSCIRFAGANAQQNMIHDNSCMDTQASPTTQSGVALDSSIGAGNGIGINWTYNLASTPYRGSGNANSLPSIPNQNCLFSFQNTNATPGFCLIQSNSSSGISLGDGASGRTITFGSSTIGTTNCQLGGATGTASPAACGAATSGAIAIPASQTSYTVNTTGVTANSEIIVQQITDNSGLPSGPTCNAGATTPIQSARVAGTSFTFTLTSVASVTCVKYWIVN